MPLDFWRFRELFRLIETSVFIARVYPRPQSNRIDYILLKNAQEIFHSLSNHRKPD